jgi:hypothetical protein
MSTRQLLTRARRCHKSASAMKVHATSTQFASMDAVMRELWVAENLETLADTLERQAQASLPTARL